MTAPRNTIRTYALVIVAMTSIALIGFAAWLIYLLSGPDWCGRALGAAKYVDGRPEFAVSGCYALLKSQLLAISINSYIALGTLALCLGVLVIIVIAGGRVSFKASKTGVEADVGRDDGVEAARRVEGAAREERKEIEQEAAAAPAPAPAPTPAAAPVADDNFERDTQ